MSETPMLPKIPVVDCRSSRYPSAAACTELPGQIAELMASARRHYTDVGLRLGDHISRRWLARNSSPYIDEIDAIAHFVHRPGAHVLNASFEWACTTGVAPAEDGGMAMVRVLDWDLDGLGRTLSVIRQHGPAGDWLNVGWPGFAGCITGIAAGRFAAAINQAPLPECRIGAVFRTHGMTIPGLAADWLSDRPATWGTDAPPPAHLLRQVMDEACDYDEALRMLASRQIAAPALFVLAGPGPGQGAVVERTRDRAAVRRADPAVAAANHWTSMPVRGEPRWRDDSHLREQTMLRQIPAIIRDGCPQRLDPPVRTKMTRLIAVMGPRTGSLGLQGFERNGPATAPLMLPGA